MPKTFSFLLSFFLFALLAFSDEYTDFQKAIDYDKLMTQVIEQTRQAMDAQLSKILERAPTEQREAIAKDLSAVNQSLLTEYLSSEKMKTLNLDLLKKYYSPEEVKQLTAFYQTDIGKKSLQIMPQMTNEIMNWTMAQQQEMGRKISTEYRAVFQKHNPPAPSDKTS